MNISNKLFCGFGFYSVYVTVKTKYQNQNTNVRAKNHISTGELYFTTFNHNDFRCSEANSDNFFESSE